MTLVASARHRQDDLALWRELEEADLVHGARPALAEKVERSLLAIAAFAAAGQCVAMTSWGKDSVALCHLLREAAPSVPLAHLRPTNHNPDCDAVRDDYLTRFPGQTYEEVPVDYGRLHAAGLPHQELDLATDRIWYAAARAAEQPFGRRLTGVRSDESYGRKIRCLRWGVSSRTACAPLAWWKAADVFAYLAANALPVHPAYAMLGAGRWPRGRLRVAEIGDTHGTGGGRLEWEREYYGDVLRQLAGRGLPSIGRGWRA